MVLINPEPDAGDARRKLRATVAAWMGDTEDAQPSSSTAEPIARPGRLGAGAVSRADATSVPEAVTARLIGRRRGAKSGTMHARAQGDKTEDEVEEEEGEGKLSLLEGRKKRRTVSELALEEEKERERKRSKRKRRRRGASSDAEEAQAPAEEEAINSQSEAQMDPAPSTVEEAKQSGGHEDGVDQQMQSNSGDVSAAVEEEPVEEEKQPPKQTRQVPHLHSTAHIKPPYPHCASRCALRLTSPGDVLVCTAA